MNQTTINNSLMHISTHDGSQLDNELYQLAKLNDSLKRSKIGLFRNKYDRKDKVRRVDTNRLNNES